MTSTILYGSYEFEPVCLTENEAWMCLDGAWDPMNVADANVKAGLMTEAEFKDTYGELPPLPSEAFKS